MKALVLETQGERLILRDYPVPEPGAHEILIKVKACGVCRTDLHIIDGELTQPKLPIVPGHEIVGSVAGVGSAVQNFAPGDLVGVPWLGETCGSCSYCLKGKENLCDAAVFTGYLRDGGYAEYAVANARYCFALPESYDPVATAPLLCAGLIGWRSLKLCGDCKTLGLYGFGASAHIVIQIALHQGKTVFAFTKLGDSAGQAFAKELGATWAGGSDTSPPELMDASIIFAPVGSLIPAALASTCKGGTVVCAGIHMSDIPSFKYDLLWGERTVRSVANLTRSDGMEFFALAPSIPVKTSVTAYPLEQANEALDDLRYGRVVGAAVLVPELVPFVVDLVGDPLTKRIKPG